MFKKIGVVSFLAGILFATTAANAIPIVDVVDTFDNNGFLHTGDSIGYTHNLLDNGFITGTATGGTLEIQFSDDTSDAGIWRDESAWEVILITVDNFDFDTGGLSISTTAQSFSNELEVNALAKVNSSGMLDIAITSLWGDFIIEKSILTVDGEITGGGSILTSEVSSVPEPGILGMLAIGLIGIGLARRKAL
jgi:hypothetical protein